jgi:hypothetical protein
MVPCLGAIPPSAYKEGYPVTVASHIAVALQLRELRGEQSQTDIARKLGLSANKNASVNIRVAPTWILFLNIESSLIK